MVLGLICNDGIKHKLAKVHFLEDRCSDQVFFSMHLVQKELLSCHTINDNLIIAFYKQNACLFDGDLDCKHQIPWNKMLPIDVSLLTNFGIAENHADFEEIGLICGFGISRNAT